MEVDCLPFRETGYFSTLICDYLDEKKELQAFYHRFPTLEGFKAQIAEKAASFPMENRAVLLKALENQYETVQASELTRQNIKKLGNKTTFTVVTGHQLNLFTGPLYFLYKIISTIKLTQQLKEKYPKYDFVPIYWMATEDHDFDEINYFNYDGKKVQWNKTASGAVGRLDTGGLNKVHEVMATAFGETANATQLKLFFENAYLGHDTVASATRYLANALFESYGLVIIDGDDRDLKKLLTPFIKKDIFDHLPYRKVSESIESLAAVSSDYKIQVNPREINYFYLKDNIRERIIKKDGHYFVNDTDINFSKNQLEEEIDAHPERFSPNVIARPLFQEVILPNLCYIGGGGELAYWLELKSYFDALKVTFPMLLLRNSVLLIGKKQAKKVKKLDLELADLFLGQNQLINKKIRQISNVDIDFSLQKRHLEEQFQGLYALAEKTDRSFLGAVNAQEVKQKKGLDNLEKRLLKAQKNKLKDHVVRLTALQNELFPSYSLQERLLNFSEPYLDQGDGLIPLLFSSLDPLSKNFTIVYT